MGSPLRFQVASDGLPSDPPARNRTVGNAWDEILDEFEAVEAAMSRFRESSEITRLHRTDGPALGLSRRLARALTTADRARRATAGRFDPRIIRDLERLGSRAVPQVRDGSPPADPEAPLLRRAGRTGPIELLAPVDLGGIGKGLALRWAARRARRALGGAAFLLEAGGDIVTAGSPAGESWSIGIEDPAGSGTPVAVVRPPVDGAVSTSSVRIGRWLAPGGAPVHHLIDPKTGAPGGDGLAAVTVAHADSAWAEIWSKALFLEGAAGVALVARRRGLAAWWVSVDGDLGMTPAARALTFWVAAEAMRA